MIFKIRDSFCLATQFFFSITKLTTLIFTNVVIMPHHQGNLVKDQWNEAHILQKLRNCPLSSDTYKSFSFPLSRKVISVNSTEKDFGN